jgi:2-polyprenyl-6-methoxyphenol hydroxylase-like FAD-dependent oxidoreductase
MRIVICGAGIAGLTLAWCLERQGHEPLVVEQRPQLSDEGYMLDFFGAGFDAAERLGLLADLEEIHAPVGRLVFVDDRGRERVRVPYRVLRSRLFGGRHFIVMRGALQRTLYEKLRARHGICFGTTVQSVTQGEHHVEVTLSSGTVVTADLLVGADGLHSRIRRLVFGEDRAFLRPLGYTAAAYVIAAPPPGLQMQDTVLTITAPNRQLTLSPIDDERTATFFAYADTQAGVPRTDPCQELSRVYHGLGWTVLEALTRCPAARDVYFDSVVQVDMPVWHRGRVVLLGDACQCVSPLAGQGASLAMAGAYVLARALARETNTADAVTEYERRMRPVAEAQQRTGRRLAHWFVPRSQWQLTVRDALTRAATWPVAASVIRSGTATDRLLLA